MRSNDANKLNLKINQDKTWVELDVGMEGNTLEELMEYLKFCWDCPENVLNQASEYLADVFREASMRKLFKDGSLHVVISRISAEPAKLMSDGNKKVRLMIELYEPQTEPTELIIKIKKNGRWIDPHLCLGGEDLEELAIYVAGYFDCPKEHIEKTINLFHETYIKNSKNKSETLRMKNTSNGDKRYKIEFYLNARPE